MILLVSSPTKLRTNISPFLHKERRWTNISPFLDEERRQTRQDILHNALICMVMTRSRFHKKSQFKTSFGLSLGLKSETFVSAEFLAQMDFTKGGSAETGLKS